MLGWSLKAYATLKSYKNNNNPNKNSDAVKRMCWILDKELEQ